MKLRIVEMPDGKFAVQRKCPYWFGWDFIGKDWWFEDEDRPRGVYGSKLGHHLPTMFVPSVYETIADAKASAERYRAQARREKARPVIIKEALA